MDETKGVVTELVLEFTTQGYRVMFKLVKARLQPLRYL